MMDGGLVDTAKEGFDLISRRDGSDGRKVAFYCNALHAQSQLLGADACRVVRVATEPNRKLLSMAVAKGSPLTKVFARVLLRVLQDGFYRRQLAARLPSSAAACETSAADLGLGFNKLWFMFFVLVLGGGLGMVFLLAEFCSGGASMDVFAEERRKTFRPAFEHLVALNQWVGESGCEPENGPELEMVESHVKRIEASLAVAKTMKAALTRKKMWED